MIKTLKQIVDLRKDLGLCGSKRILSRRIVFRALDSDGHSLSNSSENPSNSSENPSNSSENPSNSSENQLEHLSPQFVLLDGSVLCNEIVFEKPSVGIYNEGNTCYMNQVLQCLIHTPPLANYFLSGKHFKVCKSRGLCWTCELAKLTMECIGPKGSRKPIRAKGFVENLINLSRTFRPGGVQDSHEFLRYLTSRMQTGLLSKGDNKNGNKNSNKNDNKNDDKLDFFSKNTTLVNRVFGCYLRSRVRCFTCGRKSDTYEPAMDFSLCIRKGPRLEDLLKHLFRVERLRDKYVCAQCKSSQPSSKEMTIRTLPLIATIHLKRFDYVSHSFVKLNSKVIYPEFLDLAPYMTKGAKAVYQLYALVVHLGSSPDNGHYVSYARSYSNFWYEFNDSKIRKVHKDLVLNQNNAYILFYKLYQGTCQDLNKPKFTQKPESVNSQNSKPQVDNLRPKVDNLRPQVDNLRPQVDNPTRDSHGLQVSQSVDALGSGLAAKREQIPKFSAFNSKVFTWETSEAERGAAIRNEIVSREKYTMHRPSRYDMEYDAGAIKKIKTNSRL